MDAVGGASQGMGRPSGSALATSCSWKKSGLYCIGSAIALPRIDSEDGIVLHRWTSDGALVESADRILEPPRTNELVRNDDVDLVIVPALAVDARGHRIGSGHGYYDRFLPRLVRAHKVGFVYDFQLLAELPNTRGDVRVDAIVSDRRVISLLAHETERA